MIQNWCMIVAGNWLLAEKLIRVMGDSLADLELFGHLYY